MAIPSQDSKKEDFTVFQGGKPQAVTILEEAEATPSLIQLASGPTGEFTNIFVGALHPQRLTIIVIDTMHSPFVDQAYARQQLIKYLASVVDERQPIALVVLSLKRFQVIHDFATNPKVLVAALNQVRVHAQEVSADVVPTAIRTTSFDPKTEQEARDLTTFEANSAQQISELQHQLVETKTDEYMQQLAHAFSSVPGRKSILWIASSPPRPSLPTLNLLVNVQMAIYPVDARGLTTPEYESAAPFFAGQKQSSVDDRVKANQNIIFGFRLLAEQTGGRAFFNRNDLDNSFHEAVSDSSGYYLLSFYRLPDDRQVGWRKLSVKVNRKGVQIRARNGYLVPGGREYVYSDKSAVELALESPWNFTALPFAVRWLQTKPNAMTGKTTVGLEVRLPGGLDLVNESDGNHLRLEFSAVALNGEGKQVAEASERIDTRMKLEEVSNLHATGTVFESHFDVAPSNYTVKFVVVDALTGRIGSITAPLTVVPLHQ